MKRRDFLKFAGLSLPFLGGCGINRIDPWHVLIRSDVIQSLEQEAQVLDKAKLGWTLDGRVRVIYLRGSPYEIGYQHGALLRREVQINLETLYRRSLSYFNFSELFDECYERMRPFIPQEYVEEMHGLAHGARISLELVHAIHALPEIGEWGGTKQVVSVVKKMMRGELATSCSNLCIEPKSSGDGEMYTVRILDWGLHRLSRLHEFPLIAVCRPDQGIPFVNIGWMGFLGAISGINSQQITLGEMGYGNPPGETLRGKPMPFLLRDVLAHASSMADVRRIISQSPGTNSFVYLMSDGKTGESELYIRDKDRFLVNSPGEPVHDGKHDAPGIENMTYGGHYLGKMAELLNQYKGKVTMELLRDVIIPQIAMRSNFQNVIYAPHQLQFWVSNAASKSERAAEQPYTHFDFAAALREFS